MYMKTKVVRVSATEFELDDGRVFPHIVPLEPVPTPEEFQVFYDLWSDRLKNGDVQRPNTHQESG
jgi:hypothetical protein